MLNKLFKLKEHNTSVKTEMLAGVTVFMTVAYILAVNPAILSLSDVAGCTLGIPKGGVFIATALAAFFGTLLMALFANYPFVLAPGMGLNAYFAFTVVLQMGYSWQYALLAVFTEGLIFLALSLTSVRQAIFNAIPLALKKAVAAGIGLFIALIALVNAKIVVNNDATLVSMTKFDLQTFHTSGICAILAIVGTILTAVLMVKRVKAAILFGILGTWVLGMVCEATGLYTVDAAKGYFSLYPQISFDSLAGSFSEFKATCGALFDSSAWVNRNTPEITGWQLLKSFDFAVVVFAFLFVDLFDTLGTLIGVSTKGKFLDKDGQLPRLSGALYADSIATSVGAFFGTSTTTTFVESASAVSAGGKTGLTALFAAVLFLIAIPFAPIFLAIPGFATAPALLIVGFLMISAIADIDFNDMSESIPAFLSIAAMPLCYSISEGIMWGVISYTFINLLCGNVRKISVVMYILTALFIAKYALL